MKRLSVLLFVLLLSGCKCGCSAPANVTQFAADGTTVNQWYGVDIRSTSDQMVKFETKEGAVILLSAPHSVVYPKEKKDD